MDKLRAWSSLVLNGNPDSGVGNITRAGMSAMIPILLGLGGATIQSINSPELGIIPPLVTMLVPIAIGVVEMFRQFRIIDRKNDEIDMKHQRLLADAFADFTNVGTPNIHLYRHKKRK